MTTYKLPEAHRSTVAMIQNGFVVTQELPGFDLKISTTQARVTHRYNFHHQPGHEIILRQAMDGTPNRYMIDTEFVTEAEAHAALDKALNAAAAWATK